MSTKGDAAILSKRRRGRIERAADPLEVRLTVSFKFGDDAGDRVTMMQDRRVPMVDSVFKSRDRILRSFAVLLVKAGAAQPKVAREIVPLLRLVTRRGRESKPAKKKR